MSKVALINPRGFGSISERGTHFGLGYLASACRVLGHEVRVFAFDNMSPAEETCFHKTLIDWKPLVVGMTIHSFNLAAARDLATHLRRAIDNVCIIAGGVHASTCDERFLRDMGGLFDAVCIGEGEITLPEVIACREKGESLESVKGLTLFCDGRIIRTASRQVIEDIDQLPFPDYEAFEPAVSLKERYPIVTSRGCPYGCVFCVSKTFWNRRLRARSPGNVLEELRDAKERHGFRELQIYDDNFTFNKERAIEICRAIADERLCDELSLMNGIRADSVDEELAQWLVRAGLKYLMIGVEDGNEDTFRLLQKGETHAQITNAVQIFKKLGIRVEATMVIGLPETTFDTTMRSMEFLKRHDLHGHWIVAVPFWGTELYDYAESRGRLLMDPRAGFSQGMVNFPPLIAFDTPEFPAEERLRAFETVNCMSENYHFLAGPNEDLRLAAERISRRAAELDPENIQRHRRRIREVFCLPTETATPAAEIHREVTQPDNVPLKLPEAITIEVTNGCTMSCAHCLYQRERDTIRVISDDYLEKLTGVITSASFVGLDGGGEILSNWKTIGVLHKVARLAPVAITTNGKNLSDAVLDELPLERITDLHISFDGFNDRIWSVLRKGNDAATVLSAIERTARAIAVRHAPTKLWANVMLSTLNVDELSKIIRELSARGVGYFHFIHLIALAPEQEKYSLFSLPHTCNRAITAAKATAQKLQVTLVAPPLFGNPRVPQGEAWPFHYPCNEPFRKTFIRSNGDVTACCDPRGVIGNLAKHTFAEIWQGDAYNAFRTGVNVQKPRKECSECIHPTYMNVDAIEVPRCYPQESATAAAPKVKPAEAALRFKRGMEAMRLRHLAQARQLFTEALQANPGFDQAKDALDSLAQIINRYTNTGMNSFESTVLPDILCSKPVLLYAEASTKCNILCTMCAREESFLKDIPRIDMDLDIFKKLSEMFREGSQLALFGRGETLLNPHFVNMLTLAKEGEMTVSFNSNGTRITDEIAEQMVLLEQNALVISFSAGEKETYERVHKGARYDKTIENIKRINGFKEKYGKKLPLLNFEFVAMRQNIEELPALIRLAHTLQVDRIMVIHLTVHDGINREQLLDQPEYLELTTAVFNASKVLAHELGIELRLPVLMNPLTKKFAETQEEIDATIKGIDPQISTEGLCLEPWQTFYVRSNGDVMPCVITNRCMGNLANQTAEEVWNGEVFQSFRKRMKSSDKPPECKVCHLLPGNRVLDKRLYYDPSFYQTEL